MARKLSLATAIALAFSPVGAYALGVGELQTKSALNQHFDGSIELLSVAQGELDGVKVSLASPAAFQRAGIDRPFLLSHLRFKPERLRDGRAVIKVTSRDPVREPFLNFLIEVNWPKGTLVREYTVLLDPPVTLARRPAPVKAPTTAARPSMPPAVSRAPAAMTPTMSSGSVAMTSGAYEYGPTQQNDTLWSVATAMNVPGASVHQVMMALLRNNPHAFIDNNVNNLMVGKILRLESADQASEMSQAQAHQEFLAQTKIWQETRSAPKAAMAAPQPTSEPSDAAEEQPVTAETSGKAAQAGELRLASAETQESMAGGAGTAESDEVRQLRNELLIVREQNESSRQDTTEMRNRVQELESQLEKIQRLLTLRSDELAQLQAAQKTDEGTAVVPATDEAMPADTEESTAVVPAMDQTMPAAAESAESETAATEAESTAAPEDVAELEKSPETVAIEPVPEEQPGAAAAGPGEPAPLAEQQVAMVDAATADAEAESAAMIPVAAPEKTSIMDKLTGVFQGNTTVMGIAGGAIAILLALIMLMIKRRREADSVFEESILVPAAAGDVSTTLLDRAGAANEQSEETSFLSDFSPSDIDSLQDDTGEVDPLSEADVYIAYGRYQQAEELIRQALQREPERMELKEKLLEVQFSNKDTAGFLALAGELKAAGLDRSDAKAWSRIVAMGGELAPENDLFSLTPDFTESAYDEQPVPEYLDQDQTLIAEVAPSESDLKLELDEAAVAPAAVMDEGLDFDLGDLGEFDTVDAALNEHQDAIPTEELELDETLLHTNLEQGEESIPEINLGDLDLDESESYEVYSGMGEGGETIEAAGELDDEINTKLDLARAYVDMGDADGARTILEEVISEGDDSQKEEAETLIAKLS